MQLVQGWCTMPAWSCQRCMQCHNVCHKSHAVPHRSIQSACKLNPGTHCTAICPWPRCMRIPFICACTFQGHAHAQVQAQAQAHAHPHAHAHAHLHVRHMRTFSRAARSASLAAPPGMRLASWAAMGMRVGVLGRPTLMGARPPTLLRGAPSAAPPAAAAAVSPPSDATNRVVASGEGDGAPRAAAAAAAAGGSAKSWLASLGGDSWPCLAIWII